MLLEIRAILTNFKTTAFIPKKLVTIAVTFWEKYFAQQMQKYTKI